MRIVLIRTGNGVECQTVKYTDMEKSSGYLEKYDLTKVEEFFKERFEIRPVIEKMKEMRMTYVEMTLCLEVLHNSGGNERAPEAWPHEDALEHSWILGELIKLMESMLPQPEPEQSAKRVVIDPETGQVIDYEKECTELRKSHNETLGKLIEAKEEILRLKRGV